MRTLENEGQPNLKQTTFKAKSKINKETLDRRKKLWRKKLAREWKAIQSKLKSAFRKKDANERAERFNELMVHGNIKAAVRLLSTVDRGGVLPLNEGTMTDDRADS